jgi:acyl carrier protein
VDDLAAHTERVIRTALAEQGGMGEAVSRARGDDDLYARGLTSLGSVRVMLVIEATLMIEFPEAWLNRELFATITNLSTACIRLMDPAAVAGHWGAQG